MRETKRLLMRYCLPLAVLLPAALLWAALVSRLPEVIDLGDLGGGESMAAAVNARGTVVGWSQTRAGEWHAFRWTGGPIQDLGTLGGGESYATAINSAGDIVGESRTASGEERAFLWRRGRMRDLGTLPGFRGSTALDINDRGQVVGAVGVGQSEPGWPDDTGDAAFLWQYGRMADLNRLTRTPRVGTLFDARGINNRGEIVGEAMIEGRRQYAYLWKRGTVRDLTGDLGDLEPGAATGADHINDRRNVTAEVAGNNWRYAVLWRNGHVTEIAPHRHQYVDVRCIRQDGALSGWIGGRDDTGRAYSFAFVGSAGSIRDLNRVRHRGSRMHLEDARGIDDHGDIVGEGIVADHRRAFLFRGALPRMARRRTTPR